METEADDDDGAKDFLTAAGPLPFWVRPAEGFQWRDDLESVGEPRSGPWLVPIGPLRVPVETRVSRSLIEAFAQLPGDPQRILKFANAYGWLGLSMPAQARNGAQFRAEPLDLWNEQASDAARILQLVEGAVKLHRTGAEVTRRQVLALLPSRPRGNAPYPEVAAEAMGRAAMMVEARLDAAITFRLTPWSEVGAGGLRFEPKSFLGAIYLELAREVARARPQRICPVCLEPFTPRRRDQIYDKPACVSKASYRRTSKEKR